MLDLEGGKSIWGLQIAKWKEKSQQAGAAERPLKRVLTTGEKTTSQTGYGVWNHVYIYIYIYI
jgi:hypothetical protein